MMSGAYETVMLAAQVAVGLGLPDPDPRLRSLWSAKLETERGGVPLWWDVVYGSLDIGLDYP